MALMDSTVGLVLFITWFFALNITFNAYNKFLFSPVEKNGAGLQIPLFATMTHAFAGMMCAAFMTLIPSLYERKVITDKKQYLQLGGIAAFFAASIGFNNSSLKFLALSMQQIIRSALPAVMAITTFLIEGKTFTKQQIATLCALVGGVMLAVLGDIEGTEPIGVFLCLGSVAGTALQYCYVSLCMSAENKLKGFDMLLYTGLPTIAVLTPAMILTGEPKKLGDYAELNGTDKAIGYILIGQALAIAYNLTTFMFIHNLSATYLTVCGVFKVVLVIGFSVLVLGDTINTLNGMGLVIALTAFAFNSYLKFQEKKSA